MQNNKNLKIASGIAAASSFLWLFRSFSGVFNKQGNDSFFNVIKNTLFVRSYAMMKIPMLGYTRPVIEELSDNRCVVKIPLNHRTKNHLNSMYFGVLACGADCVSGLAAMKYIRDSGKKVSFVFKDFQAEFLKRPENDVLFICDNVIPVKDLVRRAIESGEREETTVDAYAVTIDNQDEPVARFSLTMSVKKKS